MPAWDQFWQDSSAEASYIGATGTHSVFTDHWIAFFQSLGQLPPESRCIDVASGTGIVIQCARTHFGDRMPRFTALDLSSAAIDQLTERLPGVEGIVADAADIPFDSGSFDVVTSQFGAEYAGTKGIEEAARLVGPQGHLALVLHCRPGAIHDECATSLHVADQVRSARVFPLAKAMFQAGFEAAQGGDYQRHERAVRKFRPALRTLQRAIDKHGVGVASGFVVRLQNDLEQIGGRLQNYDAKEVMNWLSKMSRELLSYRARMKSMTDSAMNQAQLARVCETLSRNGFAISETTAMTRPEDSTRMSWSVKARRLSSDD